MSISAKFEGEKKFFAFLERLRSDRERERLLDNLGAYGVSSTQQRFIDEKSPDGKTWEKSRRAMALGGKTLRKSARLYQSLTHKATSEFVEWGTNVIYAGIHHFGGVIRAKNAPALYFKGLNGEDVVVKSVTIPARPYLGISALDRQEINERTRRWVEEMQP